MQVELHPIPVKQSWKLSCKIIILANVLVEVIYLYAHSKMVEPYKEEYVSNPQVLEGNWQWWTVLKPLQHTFL